MRRVSRVSATGTRTPSSATTPGTTRAMNIGACTLTRRSRRLTRSPEVLVTTAEPWVRTPPRTFITLFFLRALPNLFFPMARAVPPVGTPRPADAIANGPIAPSPRVVHVLHESNLTSIVPLRPLSIRRLAPVEEGSRVQADALQRLWHPLPEDEQPRALDPDGSRGPGGGAQKEDTPRISYVVAQPGEETPVRADRDHGHREPSSQRRARVTGRGSRGVDCRRAKEETGTGDKIASELSLYVIRRGK